MASIKLALNYLLHDQRRLCDSIVKNYGQWLSDTLYLSIRFRLNMGYWPDLKNPRNFFEKITYLKLQNRDERYSIMVDKYLVKEYMKDLLGKEFIPQILGVWNSIEEIDWTSLPKKFVLKTTHGGGSCGVVVCRDKDLFDKDKACKKLKESLEEDIYRNWREYPYKDVVKRIIAEEYISPKNKYDSDTYDLTDYKFFCFNGVPKYCQVIRDRHTKETIDFYDMEWHHQNFVGLNPIASNGIKPVECPLQLEKMKELCCKIAKGIPFVRVDLYNVDGKIYFGETTFSPASGIGCFTPTEWGNKLGEMIII